MERGRRLSIEQKSELWDRWKRGETLVEIGRALGSSVPNVFTQLRSHGGIAPAARKRRADQLRLEEREEISRGLAAREALRAIAARLGRDASTISREVARNGGRRFYRAADAEACAQSEALRPKPCLLAVNAKLRNAVAGKLEQRWSPQQIAGWLKLEYASDETMRVSHETIYKSLFIQARGVLKRELLAALRSRRVMRRAKGARSKGMKRSLIRVDPRTSGRGRRSRRAGTLGRRSLGRRRLADRHPGGAALALRHAGAHRRHQEVTTALARQVRKLPRRLKGSLTWDRGSELTEHAKFTVATNVKVYFCDPHSPWQRGSNENTNGLLRQYFPKGSDLAAFTQAQLDAVARELNTRPRKTLGYRTPAAVFDEALR